MPAAYSVRSTMTDKPYAIGERPGGNYIPTIPLLSGQDAWDSLSQYYDKRFSLPYDTSARGPRHRQDVLNKAARLELRKLAEHHPVIYGFVRGCLDQGADGRYLYSIIKEASERCDGFAESVQAAEPVLDRFIKQAFGSSGVPLPGFNAPKLTTPKPTAANVGVKPMQATVDTFRQLGQSELEKFRGQYNQQGDKAWGQRWRQAHQEFEPKIEQGAAWQHFNPYYQEPSEQLTPAQQQRQMRTQYWMGEGPPSWSMDQGAAQEMGLVRGEPQDVQFVKTVSENTGIDPTTLMMGMQAQQHLTQAAAQAGGQPNREQYAAAFEQLPDQSKSALKAWQYAQQTSPNLYDANQDNPAWLTQLRPDVKKQLSANPETAALIEQGRYLGRPGDWEGMEGLAKRWKVDPREQAFQDYWNQTAQQVQQDGWGAPNTPQRIEDLMRIYSRKKAGKLQMLDETLREKDPTMLTQRVVGYRHEDPYTGQEVISTPPGFAERMGQLGFLGTLGAVGNTAVSAYGAPGAILADAVDYLETGNTNLDYSKMMARSLLKGPNQIAGTDVGHNVLMNRPQSAEQQNANRVLFGDSMPREQSNRGFWTGSAAPEWKQGLEYGGDEGQMGLVANQYGDMANDPNSNYLQRIGAQTAENFFRNVEIPLEMAATGKIMGNVGRPVGGASGNLGMASRTGQGLRSLGSALRTAPGGARLGGGLLRAGTGLRGLKDMQAVGAGLQGGEKALNRMAGAFSMMADPRWQAPIAAIEQGEIPGTGNRVRDYQQAAAQASREWGQNPEAGLLQNILGETGATAAEMGPTMMVAGGPSLATAGKQGIVPTLQQVGKATVTNPMIGTAVLQNASPLIGAATQGDQTRKEVAMDRLAKLYPESVEPHQETGEPAYQANKWLPRITGEESWRDSSKPPAAIPPPEQVQQAVQESGQNPITMGLDEQRLQEAGPEAEVQVYGAARQVLENSDKMNPDKYREMVEAAESGNIESPAAKMQIQQFSEQTGLPDDQAIEGWNSMDTGSKVLLGMGLGLGVISLISSLAGKGGAMGWLGSLLGFGAATGVLANSGAFGPEASNFVQSLFSGGQPGDQGEEFKQVMRGEHPTQAGAAEDVAEPVLEPAQQPGATGRIEEASVPAQPAAKPMPQEELNQAEPEPARPTLDSLAKEHNLPMGLGDPDKFDRPDQEAAISNYVQSGTGSKALYDMAKQLSPEQRQEIKQQVKKRIDNLNLAESMVYHTSPAMQKRVDWLMSL